MEPGARAPRGRRRVAGKKRVIFCLFWPRHVTRLLDGAITVLIFVACGRKRRRLCSSISRACLFIARVHASMRQDELLGSCEAAIGVAARWKGRLLNRALHSRWTSNPDLQPCKAASSVALITISNSSFRNCRHSPSHFPAAAAKIGICGVSCSFANQNLVWSSPKMQCNATHRRSCFYQRMRVGGLERISGHFFWSIWSWPPKKDGLPILSVSLKMEAHPFSLGPSASATHSFFVRS